VTCKSCGSDKQSKFTAEIAIHFPGLSGLEKPIVWVFPKVFVCLNCGPADLTRQFAPQTLSCGGFLVTNSAVTSWCIPVTVEIAELPRRIEGE